VKKLTLLLAAGSLWLFLAAVPVFADGGPHVKNDNSGVSTLAADGCAGCHRAHTAQGEMLIKAPTEEELCLACHGAAGVGSVVDVETGTQYAIDGGARGAVLGALRGGGFDQARIDAGDMIRLSYLRNATAVSQRPKVGVGALEDVTSAHITNSANGLTQPGIAWGNGVAGSGAGPSADISCADCHNPHGNGNYRILNIVRENATIDDTQPVNVIGVLTTSNRIHTDVSHGFLAGDVVTTLGVSGVTDGSYTVATVSSNYFTLTGVTIAADNTVPAGTVTKISGTIVSDAPTAAAGDTRNYTVMQVKGTEGTDSTYLLYASQVEAAALAGSFNLINGDYSATGGDYFARNVPWNPQVNNAACDPTVYPAPAACATANSAPNGKPSTFSAQITQYCASCHTRYFANSNQTASTTDAWDATGAAWAEPRPGDSLYNHQHRTVAGRDCLTCHVSHGSNAAMTGTFSSSFPYPNGTVSASSRLLKVDNRGTCQACHDPTLTIAAGTLLPTGATPVVP
jgi:predicted CXXCH cytochrome family protein